MTIELIRPKRPEFSTYASRLMTFLDWPQDHPLTQEELARHGFYYAGYFDCTRCYYCGGAIRNWEPDDDVQLEHARWFSCCPLVLSTLGKDVVDIVSYMQRNNIKITIESVNNERNRQQTNQFQDCPMDQSKSGDIEILQSNNLI
ncbi:hypothetical protein RRG08_060743 [Elysia crispata]|uniref:Uncharacterized protein n=1 Tax=Elysia crispata TaxID=231223 RepID=A0AAE0YF33_9GAST|nr:hypothetical protein RRG08_060743 [Elysia crispata]